MAPKHPIKEFAEEIEPQTRQCLFCNAHPPDHLPKEHMRGKKGGYERGWYSNALLNLKTGEIARFYLCPDHTDRATEAFGWAREGFEKGDPNAH